MTSTVRLSVGDALAGRLPPVCCVRGVPADGRVAVVVPKRLGLAWCLLLAGPIGVVVLAMLWPRLRVRYLVRLPMCAAAFARMHTLRVRRLWCAWLGGAGLVTAPMLLGLPAVGVVVLVGALGSLGVALAAHLRLPWTVPSAIVDTSGRWITVRGVHPRFAEAVERAR